MLQLTPCYNLPSSSLLDVAATQLNVQVLIILFTNKKLINEQAFYRTFLAMSDVCAA